MDHWKRNSEQRELAWKYLLETIDPTIALLQEAVPLESLYNDRHVIYHEIDAKRRWGNAIVSKYPIKREIYTNNCYPKTKTISLL